MHGQTTLGKKFWSAVCVVSPSKQGKVRAADTSPAYLEGDMTHAQQVNTSYSRKFSTDNLFCILYFNIYSESRI